jgi:hypothetical protein
MKAKTPSHIVAYECVEGTVDRDKIYSLIGQYNRMQGVKLWVVSTSGFRNDVVCAASASFVGLMRIDLNTGVNADSFILPRSVEDRARRQRGIEMMKGDRYMEYPLLSWRGEMVTSSMAEILAADGVRVKDGLLLKSPYISNEEIEELAEEVLGELPRWAQKPVNLDLLMRPYKLEWQWGYLPSGQLGIFSFKEGLITLSDTLRGDKNRKRFTLAHEIGYFRQPNPNTTDPEPIPWKQKQTLRGTVKKYLDSFVKEGFIISHCEYPKDKKSKDGVEIILPGRDQDTEQQPGKKKGRSKKEEG